MGLNQRTDQKTYATILSDGSIRVKCDESTEGAKKREYETSDGAKGVKWELVYESLSGLITGIEIEEGQFGEQMRVTVSDDGENIIVTTGAGSRFAESMMKKLPNVDVLKTVTLKPFSFKNDQGYDTKGVTLIQSDKKIDSFFYNDEKKEYINEFPLRPDGFSELKTKDKKKYYDGVNQFLIDYTLNVVSPKIPSLVTDIDM